MSVIIICRAADGTLHVTDDTSCQGGTLVLSLDSDAWEIRRYPAARAVAQSDLESLLAGALGHLAERVVEHAGLAEPAAVAHSLAIAALSRAKQPMRPADHVIRLGSVARLAAALERGAIAFVGEPIRPLDGASTPRYELLFRLLTGSRIVRPGRMIADAEWAGTIRDVDRAAIRQAGRLLNALTDRDVPGPVVHVNVSAADPTSTLGMVAETIRSERVDPRGLCLELTETAPVEFGAAKEFVQGAHELGCTVFADDLGDGDGGPPIARLSELGLDGIKISGPFVQAKTSPAMRQVTMALVALAHDLGMMSVAERVSDRDSEQLAQDLGFGYAQGSVVGAGIPVAQIVAIAQREAAK